MTVESKLDTLEIRVATFDKLVNKVDKPVNTLVDTLEPTDTQQDKLDTEMLKRVAPYSNHKSSSCIVHMNSNMTAGSYTHHYNHFGHIFH